MKKQLREEEKAWDLIVYELRKLGIEINENHDLEQTIIIWGKAYAEKKFWEMIPEHESES